MNSEWTLVTREKYTEEVFRMQRCLLGTVTATLLIATSAFAAPPTPAAGTAVTPNMGAVTGNGILTDRDGNPLGTWSVDGALKAGKFTGTLSATLKGQTLALPLVDNRSYLENSRCVLHAEEGRTRFEVSGPCTSNGISGYLSAFVPAGEIYSVDGFASGKLTFAKPGSAAKSGILPTTRLSCAWMERIGGNVAGQDFHYELRPSNMGFLQFTGSIYTTAHTSGTWVRGTGDEIRLISGQFAGAVGHLQPDKSGQPAVYFERDENRDKRDVHIVDPQRTSCTIKR